jgi:hypothetical protein
MAKISGKNYVNSEQGFMDIIDFLKSENLDHDKQLWEPVRMNFWNSSLHGPKSLEDPFFKENVYVWKDGGRIVAIAISEYGKDDVFFEVSSGYEFLHDNIFKWVINVWATMRRI